MLKLIISELDTPKPGFGWWPFFGVLQNSGGESHVSEVLNSVKEIKKTPARLLLHSELSRAHLQA